jgi:hypothetical protein
MLLKCAASDRRLQKHELIIEECISEIKKIFFEHAAERGLLTTGQAYIVRAIV